MLAIFLIPAGAAAAPVATAAAIAAATAAARALASRAIVAGIRAARILNEAAKDEAAEAEAAPATKADAKASSSTTIVGTKKLNCGDNGSYEDMLKKDGDNQFDRDHIPSKAALKAAAKEIIKEFAIKLTKGQTDALFRGKNSHGAIANRGQTVAIPKVDHKDHSPTNGNGVDRNSPERIEADQKDLQKATERDTKAMEDAEGKKMDAECLKKYKKAAEEMRKKSHADYIQELKDLINEIKSKVK